ncbi:Adenosyl-chloride synthase [bacterium HR21]|nr:Adenosyl-chloride synthase [bacterium HR21]
MASGPIVLLTDYGLQDTYVGVLKGVIARIAPQATVIDLLHHVRPQQVRQGAYALWAAEPYFPDGSIFVAVVDPGVGTERRAVAVEINRKYFVAPDNGLLSFVLQRYGAERAVVLENPAYRLPVVSSTFHGRDIFAPAAAYLAQGVRLEQLGMPIAVRSLQQLPPPRCEERDGVWVGEVLHIDRFGNLITSLPAERLQIGASLQERAQWRVAVRSHIIAGISRTFADVAEGELCAYVGSDGLLEIACRNGSAAIQLQITLGESVRAWRV